MAVNFLTTSLASIINPRMPQDVPTPTPTSPAPQKKPWELDWGQSAAPPPAAPRAIPRVIQGPPREPPPQTPDQKRKEAADAAAAEYKAANLGRPEPKEGYRWRADGTGQEIIPGGPADKSAATETPQAMDNARQEALSKIKLARTLRKRSKEDWFTGGGWQTLSGVPFIGQRQFDFAKDTETLKHAAALQRIMEMSAANGGKNPLTPLSNSDFQALASSLTSLDPGQSDEQFQTNLDVIEDLYRRMYQGAGGVDLEADLSGKPASGSAPEGGIPPASADDFDRSTVLAEPAGPGSLQASTTMRTVESPWMREHGARFAEMIAQGVPDAQIIGFIQRTGGDPSHFASVIAPFRRTPEFREWKRQHPNSPYPVTSTMEVPLDEQERGRAAEASSPFAAFTAGAADIPLAAIEGAAALTGNREAADEMQRRRDLMARDNPGVTIGGQLAGGLLLPAGRSLRTILPAAAGYGALHGFGSTEGDVGQRFENALGEAASGLALAGGLAGAGRAARAVPRRAPPGGDEAVALARAAGEEGVPLSRPILDPSRRDAMAYLESSIGGGGPVQRGLRATEEGIERRAAELGGDGTAYSEAGMGGGVQKAGERFIERSRDIARQMYRRAADAAGDNPVYARDAVQAIDAQIGELSRNASSNAPLIKYLQEVRSDFVDDAGNLLPKSVGDIRDIRTNLRGNISTRGLTPTDADRRIGMVLDAAKGDIARELGESAPDAVRLYDQADRFYARRQNEISNVVQKVLGSRGARMSPEAAWKAVQAMAGPRGDSAALGKLWGKLSDSERGDAAATIAETLGRKSPDEPFSPALFVQQTRAISPESRATIFGPEGARSIANLRALAKAYADTSATLNRSRSGMVQNWNQFLNQVTKYSPAVGGGAGGLAGGIPGAIAGAAAGSAATGALALARNLSARALMNPDLTRWLATAPLQTSEGAIRRHLDRLTRLAAREPDIASEALGLRDGLVRAMSGGRASEDDAEKAPDREQ